MIIPGFRVSRAGRFRPDPTALSLEDVLTTDFSLKRARYAVWARWLYS